MRLNVPGRRMCLRARGRRMPGMSEELHGRVTKGNIVGEMGNIRVAST